MQNDIIKSYLEGGIRIPFDVQWKGTLPAGKTYDRPVISLDVAATMTALADEDWETLPTTLTSDAVEEWNSAMVVFGSIIHLRGDDLLSQQKLGNQNVPVDQMMTYFSMIGKFRAAMKYVEVDKLDDHQGLIQRTLLTMWLSKKPLKVEEDHRQLAKLVKEPEKFLIKSMRAWAEAHHYSNRPQLENVKIEGDTATGTLVLPEGNRQEISFQKIEGSWRVDLPFLAGEKKDLTKKHP